MQLGATFPQTEIGPDPGAGKAYAQAVEDLGYDYTLVFDHVLGADHSVRPNWRPLPGGRAGYNHQHQFHEPFVLFGFLAGVTKRLGLATGVLILGQRQTALVAKQAAEVDVLSGGRLRLGIGTGWNDVEYEALGMNFHDRGRRSEEQIALLRALWTQEVTTFEGRWHKVTAAGINPLPAQRPIPIWLGGRDERLLKRVGRIGDGWLSNVRPAEVAECLKVIHQAAREAGRDPASIGLEVRSTIGKGSPESCADEARAWKDVAPTHLTINTMGAGLKRVDDHIEALRRFKVALDQ